MKHVFFILCGTALAMVTLTVAEAAVPRAGQTLDDTAIVGSLSEIRMGKLARPDFDDDLSTLAKRERLYRESLPSSQAATVRRVVRPSVDDPMLQAPIQRVQMQNYQYSAPTMKKAPAKVRARKPAPKKAVRPTQIRARAYPQGKHNFVLQ